jgi:GNAT superfamily N-acetyltransferase
MNTRFEKCVARPEDHAEFSRFFMELGHDDPIPDLARWRAEMMPHTFFLADGGAKVAYAFVETYGERGYVRHVVVEQKSRGRGVGRAIMDAIASGLRENGASEWELNVRSDNETAIHLYESFGMRAEYSTFVLRLDWTRVPVLPHSAQPICASDVEPHHDFLIERAFGWSTCARSPLRSRASTRAFQERSPFASRTPLSCVHFSMSCAVTSHRRHIGFSS